MRQRSSQRHGGSEPGQPGEPAVWRVSVRVIPNAARSAVEELPGGELLVRVPVPLVEGKANEAARKALAEYFGVAVSRVQLLSGARSRRKIFQIRR
jgi:uncharacterized protein YggU (UPF0235/DUF167 family)